MRYRDDRNILRVRHRILIFFIPYTASGFKAVEPVQQPVRRELSRCNDSRRSGYYRFCHTVMEALWQYPSRTFVDSKHRHEHCAGYHCILRHP